MFFLTRIGVLEKLSLGALGLAALVGVLSAMGFHSHIDFHYNKRKVLQMKLCPVRTEEAFLVRCDSMNEAFSVLKNLFHFSNSYFIDLVS